MSTEFAENNKSDNYEEIYKQKILPIFNDIEPVRVEMLKNFRKSSFLKYFLPVIILVILGIVLFLLRSVIYNRFNTIYFFITCMVPAGAILALCLVPSFYLQAKKKECIKFSKMVKMKAGKPLLEVFRHIKWISHDSTQANLTDVLLTDSQLNKSGLFISYNTRYTDDEFEGIYKGVPFKISETRMFDISGSGKNRTCICAFSGVILSFKFNKKINNRTVVATKGDLTKKNQALISALVTIPCCLEIFKHGYSHGKLILAIIILLVVFIIAKCLETKEEALEKVMLEDPVFAKRFDVYSSDQVEARYLVTPSFMERFNNLKTAFKAKNAKCSFYDDTLMIAINTNKNLFEICNLYKSLQDSSSIQEFYNELDSIYKMIEYFKLNEKTGL